MAEPDDPTACDDIDGVLAEMALGPVDGRQRAAALDHLDGCARCREALHRYAAVADALLDTVPAVEPPAGFELRALAAIGAGGGSQVAPPPPPAPLRPRRPLRRRSRTRLVAATAAAVAALGAAAAGYGVGHRQAHGGGLRQATLTAAGQRVGAAYLYAGARPWVYMGVSLGAGIGSVTCELERRGLPPATVGHFVLVGGSGSWGASSPIGAAGVTGAILVDSEGATVAHGRFGA